MRVRASDEMSMGHADELDVVDVTAFTGDETLVFLAQHACANALDTHRISPCRTAHLREKLWRADRSRLLISETPGLAGRELFRSLCEMHAAGGVEHRFDDVVVAGAPADIALELMPDGFLVELAVVAVDDV